jgi:YesN/AraC family two-component response regulator
LTEDIEENLQDDIVQEALSQVRYLPASTAMSSYSQNGGLLLLAIGFNCDDVFADLFPFCKGTDLRQHAKQVEEDLEVTVRQSIQDYISEASNMAELHRCDCHRCFDVYIKHPYDHHAKLLNAIPTQLCELQDMHHPLNSRSVYGVVKSRPVMTSLKAWKACWVSSKAILGI